MSNEPLTQADENLLAQADHGRLADLLFELRGALADVERKDAPMQAALKHAVGLVDALQAGLTCNCLLGGWYPPPYLKPSTDDHLFTQLLLAAFEIDKLINAKHPYDCVLLTAHHLWVVIERVQELLSPGYPAEVISSAFHHALRQVTEKNPLPKTAASPTQAEYQQMIEHIAALGVYLEVLEQAAGFPARDDTWGEQAVREIRGARMVLLALLFGVRQQCHLNHYVL